MAEEYEDKISLDVDPAIKSLKDLAEQADKFAREMTVKLNSIKSGFDKVETSAKSALGPFQALGANGAQAVKTLSEAQERLVSSTKSVETAARAQTTALNQQTSAQTNLKSAVDKTVASSTSQMTSLDKLRASASRLGPEYAKLSDLQLAMMSGVAPFANSIQDLARITSVSAGSISSWGTAIEATGGNVELLGKDLSEVQKLMDDANKGNASAVELFRQLGVATQTATGEMRNSVFVLRDLGEAVKKLQHDTEGLKKTKIDATAVTKTWAGSLQQGGNSLLGMVQSIGSAKGAIIGLAASMGVLTFKAWAEEASQYGQEVVNLARETGIAIPVITGLEGVMRKNNVSFQEFGLLMRSLSRQMLEAEDGTSDAARRFEALGIAVRDKTTGQMRDLFDIVVDVADAFKRFSDSPIKTADLGAVLGNVRVGARLLPLFSEGGAALRKEVEEANNLNQALGAIDTKKLDALNNKLDGVGKAWDEMKHHVIVANVEGIEASARSIEGLIRTMDRLLSRGTLMGGLFGPLGRLLPPGLRPGDAATPVSPKAVTTSGTSLGVTKSDSAGEEAPNLLKLPPDQTAMIQRAKQSIIELKDAQLGANQSLLQSEQRLRDERFKVIEEVLQANIAGINERGEAEGSEQAKLLASQRAFNQARIAGDIDTTTKQIALTRSRNAQEISELTERLTTEAAKLREKGDLTGSALVVGGVLPAQIAAMKSSQTAKIQELETTRALLQVTKDLTNAEAERAERTLALEIQKVAQKQRLVAFEHTAAAQQARDQVLVATGVKTEIEAVEEQLVRERELSSARLGIANEELGKLAGNDVAYAQKKAEIEQMILDDVQRFSTEELRIQGDKNKQRIKEEVSTAESLSKLRNAQVKVISLETPSAGGAQRIGVASSESEVARFQAEQEKLREQLQQRQVTQAQYDNLIAAAELESASNLLLIQRKAGVDALAMAEQDAQSLVNIEKMKLADLQTLMSTRAKIAEQEANVIHAEERAYIASIDRKIAAGERLSEAEIAQTKKSQAIRAADAESRAGDSFAAEYFRGLKKFTNDTTSTFNLATQLAQSTAQSMTSSFQTLFFDAMNGKFHSFQDIAMSVLNQINQMTSNLLANLATKYVMEGISGAGGVMDTLVGGAKSVIGGSAKAPGAASGKRAPQSEAGGSAVIGKELGTAGGELSKSASGLTDASGALIQSGTAVAQAGASTGAAGGILQSVGMALGIVPPLQISAATTSSATLATAAAALTAAAAALSASAAALAAGGAAKGAGGITSGIVGGLAGGLGKGAGPASAAVKVNAGGSIRKLFGFGGYANGDSVDAKLTPGEFVMSKPAVEHYGQGVMEKMNKRSFNVGGMVPGSWASTRHSDLGVRTFARGGAVETLTGSGGGRGSSSGSSGSKESSSVVMNITTPDVGGFRKSQGQLMAELKSAMNRSRRIM